MLRKALLAAGVTVYLTHNAGAQGVNQDRWAAVNGNATSSEWLDTTTIAKQGSTRYAWDQRRYSATQQVAGKPYDKVSTQTQYNCETRQTVLLQGVYYLGDSVVYSLAFDEARTSPPPGSLGETLFNYVCGKKSFLLNSVAGDPLPTSALWTFLTTAIDTSGKSSSVFVDISSISRVGSITTIWWNERTNTRLEFHSRSMFNCVSNETRWSADVIYYNGKVLSASENDPSPWRPTPATSTAGKVGRFACSWKSHNRR
jgi:hypothetical protein